MALEIYDCTLREGEQAEGASFSTNNRIELCKKLDEFGVDYIELGWPLASPEIFESFEQALAVVKNAKIVAFGSTSIHKNPAEDKNLNSIVLTKVKNACIFGKTDLEHVEKQLKINPEDNLNKIKDSINFLKQKNIEVFYDAEHYFDGYNKDSNYAVETLVSALSGGAKKLILCDTNGGILPDLAFEIIKNTKDALKKRGYSDSDYSLGVHFHNDSALALANTISCLSQISLVQGTINGIGERVGNLNFSEFLPVYIKKLKGESDIDLKKIKEINDFAFKISGLEIPEKRAFVGDSAFTHKAGVHIDALKKGAGYEHLNPEDFGNKSKILLNSLGGRGSVVQLAEQFGYNLDKNDLETKEKIQELFEELKELEEKGYRMGAVIAEQCLLIEKYFGEEKQLFQVNEWYINSELKNNKETSHFDVNCQINNNKIQEKMTVEGGPIDAAFKTLKKIFSKQCSKIEELKLVDFHVSIAVRYNEESAVRTEIFFQNKEKFSTVGVDQNILGSAIQALEKGFQYYFLNHTKTLNLKTLN